MTQPPNRETFEDLVGALDGWGTVGSRREAAAKLQTTNDPRAIEPLINALNSLKNAGDGNWQYDLVAIAEALAEIGDSRSITPLLAAFVKDRAVFKTLLRLQERGVLEGIFSPTMNHYSKEVLAIALSELEKRRGVNDLCSALVCTTYRETALTILEILRRIDDPGCAPAVINLLSPLGGCLSLDEAAGNLLAAFKDRSPAVRESRTLYAILAAEVPSNDWAWEELKSRRMVNVLSELLKPYVGKSIATPVHAVEILGQLTDDPSAVDALFKAMDTLTVRVPVFERNQLRAAAIKALYKCTSTSALEPAIRTLNDQNDTDQTRQEVALTLLCHIAGPSDLDRLLKALNHRHSHVRSRVCQRLRALENPKAIEGLLRCYLAEKEAHPRLAAALAINDIAKVSLLGVGSDVLQNILMLTDTTVEWYQGVGEVGLEKVSQDICFSRARKAASEELRRRGVDATVR